MATTTAALPRRSWLRKFAWYGLVALILAAFGLSAGLYFVARSALPQLDGQIPVPGLTAPVIVLRDAHGIPTIEASTLDDLFFAQGYVTAQDRLFQMDSMRRFAAGDLAEIAGLDALDHDRQQRILGLRAAAQKTIAVTSAADRAHFDAYARGVNAYINSHRDRLPVEFRILRYSPQPWTAEDAALIGAYMVEDLSTGPEHALTREKILAKLGPELTADLYVNSSWRDRPPTVPRPSLAQSRPPVNENARPHSSAAGSLLSRFSGSKSIPSPVGWAWHSFFQDRPLALGSNNWVVSGAHTVSGKPLLSNDMHLGQQMPNLWYEAHLRCGDFDVAGVTLPGYPYVIVGHNQRVAWGFTNVGPTVEDIYVETFNEKGEYLTPDGWRQPEHRHEVIHVKGRPDEMVEVALTRHGPVVSDLVPGETRRLALRWTLYDGIHSPFFAVNSAHNWDEFQKAFSLLDAPGQNVVYADVDGNIGYHTTGKVPVRTSGDGSLPADGSDNAHEWTGYIPFDKLPSTFNPASGVIATANSRITPDNYPYSVSAEWEAPWRSARIYRLLESGKKFTAADMLALQTDIYSDFDRILAEKFVYAVDHSRSASARAKSAVNLLRQWDGRMSADSAAPTIAVRSREELVRQLLEPRLGPAPKDPKQAKATLNWKSYHWMMSSVWLENVVQHRWKRWLPGSYVSYDELLTAAVEGAVGAAEVPRDLNEWKWGDFNHVSIQNPVLGRIPLLRRWTGPGDQPQSGSGYTVKAVTRRHGPSERLTVDLADLDQSTLNLVTGQAGNLLSPYYLDQWMAWYGGSTFAWPFSADATQKASRHQLKLVPAHSRF